MSDLKSAKDSLVSSLFELSKVAQDTANAAINFYNLDNKDNALLSGETSEGLRNISEVLKNIVIASQQVDALATGSKLNSEASLSVTSNEKPKKKKVVRDPNAPKKPLTIYFQFSFELRKLIADERKRKNLPSLSAIDMNEIIREKWANITPEEKAKWQTKYATELQEYQKLKEAYSHTDNAAAYAISTGKPLPPVAAAKKVEVLKPEPKAESSDSDSDSDSSSSSSSSDSDSDSNIIKQVSDVESSDPEPEPQPEIKKEKKRKSSKDKERKEKKKLKKN